MKSIEPGPHGGVSMVLEDVSISLAGQGAVKLQTVTIEFKICWDHKATQPVELHVGGDVQLDPKVKTTVEQHVGEFLRQKLDKLGQEAREALEGAIGGLGGKPAGLSVTVKTVKPAELKIEGGKATGQVVIEGEASLSL